MEKGNYWVRGVKAGIINDDDAEAENKMEWKGGGKKCVFMLTANIGYDGIVNNDAGSENTIEREKGGKNGVFMLT